MQIKKMHFQQHGDERGNLVALEIGTEIPFNIKRVYYMYDTLSDVRRGKHAHKKLQQILICVNGQCRIMLDDGTEKESILLNKKSEGIYIASNIWREMYEFSEDAVLMVLASELYEESDYIRNYDEFLEYINSDISDRKI